MEENLRTNRFWIVASSMSGIIAVGSTLVAIWLFGVESFLYSVLLYLSVYIVISAIIFTIFKLIGRTIYSGRIIATHYVLLILLYPIIFYTLIYFLFR